MLPLKAVAAALIHMHSFRPEDGGGTSLGNIGNRLWCQDPEDHHRLQHALFSTLAVASNIKIKL